jgi:hypothetical protein
VSGSLLFGLRCKSWRWSHSTHQALAARYSPSSFAMRRRPCASSTYSAAPSGPNRALRATERLRVDGSIPSLATISNSMIRKRFHASPADYRAVGGWGESQRGRGAR